MNPIPKSAHIITYRKRTWIL